jgi:hypothetical protein
MENNAYNLKLLKKSDVQVSTQNNWDTCIIFF